MKKSSSAFKLISMAAFAFALALLWGPVQDAHAYAQQYPRTSPVQGLEQAQEADPVAVAQAWISSLATRDFTSALSLLDDGAFLIYSPPGGDQVVTYEGKEKIDEALQNYDRDNIQTELV